jgi:hypothetical protein
VSTGIRTTGLGSWPGTDYEVALAEVARVWEGAPEGAVVVDHLLELPQRGPHAGMVGRALSMLVSMPVTLEPHGWRLAASPGREEVKARRLLAEDVQRWAAWRERHGGPDGGLGDGPAVKVQATGPLTLAATTWLAHGERVLSDLVAMEDLAVSLAEGLAAHVTEVERMTGAGSVWVQLDEPGLSAAMRGTVPTFSERSTNPPVEWETAISLFREVIEALPGRTSVAVHCCDQRTLHHDLLNAAGADAMSVDCRNLSIVWWDQITEMAEKGFGLCAGIDPVTAKPDVAAAFAQAGVTVKADRLVISPPCGLVGAGDQASAHLTGVVREAARLAEQW